MDAVLSCETYGLLPLRRVFTFLSPLQESIPKAELKQQKLNSF